MRTRVMLAVGLMLTGFAGAAVSQDHAGHTAQAAIGMASAGTLTISEGVTRATLPGAPTAGGYFTVSNAGGVADRLVSASSPVADVVEVHQMSLVNDVMRMAKLEGGLEIPAAGTVALTPGGYHLMMMGLKQALIAGETVPVTLVFEKAGTVELTLAVVAAGAPAAAGGHAGH